MDYTLIATSIEINYPKVDKSRINRALDIVRSDFVHSVMDAVTMKSFYKVRSWSSRSLYYEVDLNARTCTCPDSLMGNRCKHRIAAYIYKVHLDKSTSKTSSTHLFDEDEILTEIGFDCRHEG